MHGAPWPRSRPGHAALLTAACIVLATCGRTPGDKFLLSGDFSGWVEIEFQVSGASPLERDESGFRVVRVPDEGIVRTSDPPVYGEGRLRLYLRAHADGTTSAAQVERGFTVMPQSEVKGSKVDTPRFYFFVGEDRDWSAYLERFGPIPADAFPTIGNLRSLKGAS
jgi:hypothetical protein